MHPTQTLLASKLQWRSRMPQNTYYKNSRMSPALERARRAYLVPNIVTGAAIFSFAIAVYAYTIHAVSQDEFEDVPIPQGPMPVASAPHSGMNTSAGVTAVGVGRETAVGR